jgi:para-nitrobenzyl esterase
MGPRTPDWAGDGSLNLNLWTPRLPGDGSAPRDLPVPVWFHGGGFSSGSGGWDWYGGAERFDRTAARLANANPAEVLTEVETELVFRDGTVVIADRQAASGNAGYVYEFDYTPPDDPAHLGSAHCAEPPFFFNTIDTYPDSPMLGEPTPAARALGDAFSRAAATFVATGRPALEDWQPYEAANPATVRHFG